MHPVLEPILQRTSVDNLLGDNAEAAVERHVQAAKADLCFNPQRSATWEKLAHEYHGAADDLLVSKTVWTRRRVDVMHVLLDYCSSQTLHRVLDAFRAFLISACCCAHIPRCRTLPARSSLTESGATAVICGTGAWHLTSSMFCIICAKP